MNKAQFNFMKTCHIAVMTKGIGGDPMYFEHCLKTFYPDYVGRGDDFEFIIPDFIREVGEAARMLMSLGYLDRHWWVDPNRLLNSTYSGCKEAIAADFIVETLTGETRESWISRVKEEENSIGW